MPTVTGAGPTAGVQYTPLSLTDPMSVSLALTTLRLRPGSTVLIADTLENIQKNLDALQGQAGRITSLATTDSTAQLTVTAAQYQKDGAILATWGAGSGNTLEVTGLTAAAATGFVTAKPSYVSSVTVSDTAGNIQRNLDDLQTLVSGGSLRQIVRTGSSATLKITAAQLGTNADALAAIKNQAYALAITSATVSDTLGLDGQAALSANTRVKSIDVRDSTDAIETHLDALQRVGLRLKSISQTDEATPMTISGAQYWRDSVAIGKILTPYQLDVVRASAAQTAALAANHKVVTVSVADSAANLSRKWALLQRLSDSLTAVEVTDPTSAISITNDQLALGDGLLAKFTDDADHTYKLAVSGVKAGQAALVAATAHVSAVNVSDTAANIVANLDGLHTADDAGLLKGIALTGKGITLGLDASRLQGGLLTATQGVLDKITSGNYSLAVSGVSTTALADIAANTHVVSMEVGGTSDQIEAKLDDLYQLGKRVSRIQQSDGGTALDLTQTAFESRASVLGKIDGGYTVNVSGVTAQKALADAMNSHVASISVTDTGKSLVANWNALRSLGATLTSVTKSDAGSLALSATDYLNGQNDQLVGKFAADQLFTAQGASAAQAAQLAADAAVDRIDVTDDGSAVVDKLTELSDLATAGKLGSVTLNTGATSVQLHGSQLDGAQGVLDLVKGGRYTLTVDQVDVADAATLLAANAKIARLKVTGDAAGIAGNLADLTAAGHKLVSIEQTDAAGTALALTGDDYDLSKTTLAKVVGGYQVDLSDVVAAKASGYATNTHVKSLAVSDTGAGLATAWNALGTLGSKLSGIAQTDDAALQLTTLQWTSAHSLADRFSTPLAVSLSGVSVADLATLGTDDAVQQIQLSDNADAISAAWADLVAEAKLTQIQLSNPSTALTMSAETWAASTDLLGKVKDGLYSVALSDVAVTDAATLAADSHVSALDVTGDSGDVATAFDVLSGMAKLATLTLGDDNGSLSLSSAQILGGSDTLAKITNAYQIAATGVALADLADIQAVDEVSTIGIADSAANVSASFDDLLLLGSSLSGIQLSDATPVLTMTQSDWNAGSGALATISGNWQADLSEVDTGSVATLAANSAVHALSVSDTAANIASQWDALVAAYGDGSGKLSALALSDTEPLTLTEAQQTSGAAMITALLPDETIVTAS